MSKKIILLAGPTASGKSKLAVHLAKKLNGEVINADSMQIYKEFSILSSKPNKVDIKRAKHHLYGIVSVKKYIDNQSLKIAVRDLNEKDISSRNQNKKTKGVVITEISNRSPLANLLSVNDIIIEVQKTPVKNSVDLNKIVDGIFKKGEKTLLLTIINNNNRRRYLGVKIN